MNKDKAELFNNFFLSHSNLDDSNTKLPDEDNANVDGIENIIVSGQEVLDLLRSIDPSKSTGPDGISPKLLKEADFTIVSSLTTLFNLSLHQGKVPSMWKLANVIPLFKKGDKDNVNNYRPVSLLSCVSKILLFLNMFLIIYEISILFLNISLVFRQEIPQPINSVTFIINLHQL